MSRGSGEGKREGGRPPGRGGARPRGPRGSARPSRPGSHSTGTGRGRGPIGLSRIDGDNFELSQPRGVEEAELDYAEGIELWKAGDPESARDALRYALSAYHDNIWVHVALGQIALVEFRDPALARGHFGYAFELGRASRALPPGFSGRLPRDRPRNRPFYEAIDGLIKCLEALGRQGDCAACARRRSAVGSLQLEYAPRPGSLDHALMARRKCASLGTAVFSTLGIFRTCSDSRIGIERPQNGAQKPKEWPGTHVPCDRADGKEAERR